MREKQQQDGFVLIMVMMLLAVLGMMLTAYASVSQFEHAGTKGTKDSVTGFYAAEGGLNLRAESIRNIFVGYNRPTGSPPSDTTPCSGANLGSGDLACRTDSLGKRTVHSYVKEDATNPQILTIPLGERYQNLNAQEYRYTAIARAMNQQSKTEALLELRFKSRLVPLFQFAAFYNKDLEILPGPSMSLSGPIHVNGDLYLNAGASLNVTGQVTATGSVYRGRKNDSTCLSNPVRIANPTILTPLYSVCPARTQVLAADLPPFNRMLQIGVPGVTVPGPEVFDAAPGSPYYQKADLRLALQLNGTNNPELSQSSVAVVVRNADGSLNTTATTQLAACTGSISSNFSSLNVANKIVGASNTFKNRREAKTIQLLELDLRGLLNCLHSTNWFGTGKRLDDVTEGGLVMHLSVEGPQSSTVNSYGIRIRNAEDLYASVGGAPAPRGLSLVSDQAVYTMGHFNRGVTAGKPKIPAALMADSLNVLSLAWHNNPADYDSRTSTGSSAINGRNALATTINAAFLAGTDTTGFGMAQVEGPTGQGGNYNGGLENYPRFHESWSGVIFTYRGSMVSLNKPRHVQGLWANQSYSAPNRDWNYDVSFNNAANLPPLTPRFVYLRQELFVRQFEL